jgi:hypothetical protein
MLTAREFHEDMAAWNLEPVGFEPRLLCELMELVAAYASHGEDKRTWECFMPREPLPPDEDTVGEKLGAALNRAPVKNVTP